MLHDDICQTTVGHIRPVRLRPLLRRLMLADKLMVKKRLTLTHRFLTEVFITVSRTFRVNHNGWDFSDDCPEFIQPFSYILVPSNKAC